MNEVDALLDRLMVTAEPTVAGVVLNVGVVALGIVGSVRFVENDMEPGA